MCVTFLSRAQHGFSQHTARSEISRIVAALRHNVLVIDDDVDCVRQGSR